MKWHKKLSVGNDKLDEDHQTLFKITDRYLKESSDRDREYTTTVLAQLTYYAKRHFKREEDYMEEIGFPGLDKHRDVHDQMNAQLMKLIDRNDACEANVQADVADFLANLWIEHIRVDDKRYKDFANSHK